MKNKRQIIIESAISVFAREGLEKGKIADIAKVAGIGKGTIYEYFRSKHELFEAIELYIFEEMNTAVDKILMTDYPPSKKLEVFISQGFDSLIEMGDALLIITELWAQASRGHWHGDHKSHLASVYQDYGKKVKSILDDGVKSGVFRKMNKTGVVTMILAFMDGLAWQYILLRNPELFQRVKKEAIQSLLKGLEK
ncbi:TetR/AcrR family transcriptional regulator [Candidatus Neomarinimicrobiota bacterium]